VSDHAFKFKIAKKKHERKTEQYQAFLLTLATGQRLLPEKFNTKEVMHGKLGLNDFERRIFPKPTVLSLLR